MPALLPVARMRPISSLQAATAGQWVELLHGCRICRRLKAGCFPDELTGLPQGPPTLDARMYDSPFDAAKRRKKNRRTWDDAFMRDA